MLVVLQWGVCWPSAEYALRLTSSGCACMPVYSLCYSPWFLVVEAGSKWRRFASEELSKASATSNLILFKFVPFFCEEFRFLSLVLSFVFIRSAFIFIMINFLVVLLMFYKQTCYALDHVFVTSARLLLGPKALQNLMWVFRLYMCITIGLDRN